MLDDLLELVAERPRERAELLERLADRGHPELPGGAVNVLMPWVALQGLAVGTADGLWARATRRRRWTRTRRWPRWPAATWRATRRPGTGTWRHGRAAAGRARRALELAGPVAPAEPTEPPECASSRRSIRRCWAGRRASGWCSQAATGTCCRAAECWAVVLAGERVVGTWRGNGADTTWFGPEPPAGALAAEVADVERFLAS